MVIKFDHRYKPFDGDLLLTMACPVECDFCVYSCTADKSQEKWMPEYTIERVAEQYSKNEINIRIAGGEPFYDLNKLEECINILQKYYEPNEILIITSGFFAFNIKNTEKHIKFLNKKKINTLVVSSDRFHLKRVPLVNLENILKIASKFDVEVALRITLDGESLELLDSLAKLITKYKTPIEVHKWGIVGRAERLDKKPLKLVDMARIFFFKKITEYAKKNNAPRDIRYYLTKTSKRSQEIYAPIFFPTTFPNGDVYGCSMTMKGCYLGNINQEELLDMILRWKKTLPGFFSLSTYMCTESIKFMPEKYKYDSCFYCRNMPLNNIKSATGRVGIKINTDMDLNKLIESFNNEREYLISFRLKEEDLNRETGRTIKAFLDILEEKGVKFLLSRPLPKCLGVSISNENPENCYDCLEMFTVEEGKINFCEPFSSLSGCDFRNFKNRKEIYDYFCSTKKNFEPLKKCTLCLYFLRKQCDGLCFRKNIVSIK